MNENISLEGPSGAFSGDSRYLPRLWVSGKADELSQSATTGDYELMAAKIDHPYIQIVKDKIKAALKLLTFRDQHVLVQFWLLLVVGKQQLLTSIDQPFGLGDERLLSYRKSVPNSFVVDMDDEDEDTSPIARVFKLGLSEWSSDLANYLPKKFPQQECAIRCNLHGYLALPVFDSTTRLCVGILELLSSKKYPSFDYEVQQFEEALKAQTLTCLQVLDDRASNENELDEIFRIMKVVCRTDQLPLAQTWALSPFASVASYEQDFKKSCNRYDTRCLGNVCMSTCGLPFHVDQGGTWWNFRQECKKQHFDKSRGFISKVLSGDLCFCEDVTKLSVEVHPLVPFAPRSGLTSWFAICLHGLESNNNYVLEFFLPSHTKENKDIQDYVLEVASIFESEGKVTRTMKPAHDLPLVECGLVD